MKTLWRRYEGPTWLVAFAIYCGWLMLAATYGHLTPWIALPVIVYLTAWHSSLQHETIHAMRHVPRKIRTLMASAPLGIWFPYELYRREHIRHHAVRELAGADDPESFYIEPAVWPTLAPIVQSLYIVNQTLAGRIAIGPGLLLWRTYSAELRRLRRGDCRNVSIWLRHLAATSALLWALDAYAGISPWLYVAFVAYPALSLTLIRSFAEHRADVQQSKRTATVVSRSALSLLFLNNNLHVAHHERPHLPWYTLPEYWRVRALNAKQTGVTYRYGYWQIIRTWLLRPIDSPVSGLTQTAVSERLA